MKWRRVDKGDYETTDGRFKVVRIAESGPESWQAQERRGSWWSWISTRGRKRDAVADIESRR